MPSTYRPPRGDDPRWLTHVTVVAAGGFGPDELAAVNALRTLKLDDESPELRVQLVGLGHPQDFRTVLLGESAVWVSATPFVVTRYPKLRGRKRDRPEAYATPAAFAQQVLLEELSRLREVRPDLPAVAALEPLDGIGPQRLRPLEFYRTRRKAGDDGGRRPHGAFRLVFCGAGAGPGVPGPFVAFRPRPVHRRRRLHGGSNAVIVGAARAVKGVVMTRPTAATGRLGSLATRI